VIDKEAENDPWEDLVDEVCLSGSGSTLITDWSFNSLVLPEMRSAFAATFAITCSILIIALIGYDFLTTAGHFDVGNTSYTIFSFERAMIDGQLWHLICMGAAMTVIVCQVIQLRELRRK
jgi:hypothetical protein